jgi:hypothetical protein
MKRAIRAQRNLDDLHKQMDKVFEGLNKARKMLEQPEKCSETEEEASLAAQKSGVFKNFQNIFSRSQQQKAENAMKKTLNDSKELQKAIDMAQIEYDTAREAWKTIVYGTSQKTQNDAKSLKDNNNETAPENVEINPKNSL